MVDLLRKIAPAFLLSWYHFTLAFLGALACGFPSRKLVVIGVTGTNGKSTTVHMISRVLQERGAKTASVSSIRFQLGEKEWKNPLKMTMPGRFALQGFLRRAVKAGCRYAVLEVTSEGIAQHRHRFIAFHTAVFTNLSPEHIERHGSFEKYRNAKGKLFEAAKDLHVINADDDNSGYFLQFPAKQKILYSAKSDSAKQGLAGRNVQADENGVRFEVDGTKISLRIQGAFNAYNALAAIAVGKAHGVSLQTCKGALGKIEKIPGRMEEVASAPFRVIVDYAFTPAALEQVYQTLKSQLPMGNRQKLICVLGAAGGGRDAWKRPVLGGLAAQYCDAVVVTNEDPYGEDPQQIIEQVASGAYKIQGTSYKLQKILDRREAIRRALSLAGPGDVVVITGKGSEDAIAQGGRKIPWDERRVVLEELRGL